jgi:Domain of unknown function (DUF4157)
MHSYSDRQHIQDSKAVANGIGQKGTASRMPPNASAVFQRRSNNTNLPDKLKAAIEQLSGVNMDEVNVHYNSSKPAQLSAFAFAQGNTIHLGPGQEKHLPHEAWHVVQQQKGRVAPTMQLRGEYINDNSALEKEADVMGSKASQAHTDREGPLQLKAFCQPQSVAAVIQLARYRSVEDKELSVTIDSNSGGTFASAVKTGEEAEEFKESSLQYSLYRYRKASGDGELVRTNAPIATQTGTMEAFPTRHGIGTLIAYFAMGHMSKNGIRYFQPDALMSADGRAIKALITGTNRNGAYIEDVITRADGGGGMESAAGSEESAESCSCLDGLKALFCCGSKKETENEPLIAKQAGVRTYAAIEADFSATTGTLLAAVKKKFVEE